MASTSRHFGMIGENSNYGLLRSLGASTMSFESDASAARSVASRTGLLHTSFRSATSCGRDGTLAAAFQGNATTALPAARRANIGPAQLQCAALGRFCANRRWLILFGCRLHPLRAVASPFRFSATAIMSTTGAGAFWGRRVGGGSSGLAATYFHDASTRAFGSHDAMIGGTRAGHTSFESEATNDVYD